MRSERLSDLLYKYRWILFAISLFHMLWMHWEILGFWSWDGFGHRGFPLVELAQHGDMNKWKFHEWSLVGYIPFVELVHIPFLILFGMKGFLLGFPLVVMPLCVWAVYLLVRELTGDRRAGFFGAFAYFALPMINQQPFTAYIDFAVCGILAYQLYALVRVRNSDRPLAPYVQLAFATFLFTMSRSPAPYMLVVMFPILAYVLFCEREGRRIRIASRRKLLLAVAALAIGAMPAMGLQIYKFVTYGSPIAPMQFSFLGIEIGTGVSVEQYFKYAGLGGTDPKSLVIGAFYGWIFKWQWPLGAFYAGSQMGAGLLFVLALVLLPVFWKGSTRVERGLLAAGLLASLMSKDFAVPRCAYTTVIAIALVFGRAMSALASSRRGQPLFWIALVVLFLHMLRPEFDYLQIRKRNAYVSPRMNVTESLRWRKGRTEVNMLPGRGYRLYIVELPGNSFVLPIYGPDLSNEILGRVPKDEIGPDCRGLRPYLALHPDALFVDDHEYAKHCKRECVEQRREACLVFRIEAEPAPPPPPPAPAAPPP